jgi:leucyl-tRNA synthetase
MADHKESANSSRESKESSESAGINEYQKPKEPPSFAKRDWLRGIEKEIQAYWDEIHAFEEDAADDPSIPKYFVTFPYPYMNGRLHLGHAFTLSKCEFMVGYQRLKGKKGLFPFGLHCTGMPIKANADKIKREIETYGNPPKFPLTSEIDAKSEEQVVNDDNTDESKNHATDTKGAKSKQQQSQDTPKKAAKSKKAKVQQKAGDVKWQWDILKESGIPEELIPKFADAHYWLEYFPAVTIQDLKAMGLKVDWRRSFITTDVNPYYDSFVRWQFLKLKEQGRVLFGKRPTIYSPLDGQPCLDHDRQTGENVMPQEFVLIKQRVLDPYPRVLEPLKSSGKKIYFVPATLRPETMYGQTNCWVLPDGDYGAFEINDKEIFVCTERAALNLAYQGHSPEWGKVKCLAKFKGRDLIGTALKAPLTPYEKIYVLPMFIVNTAKTTGIVTSVPSDSPDDFVALRDIKQKENLRKAFGITDEMWKPYEVIPIIDIPGVGTTAAISVVEKLKIKSQNDRELLEQAKKEVYTEGYYKGVLIVGPYKGSKVEVAKGLIKQELLSNGDAIIYSEPESTVISRSGDVCVVALCDQWYLTYGEDKWRELAEQCLERMETYHEETRTKLLAALKWLHQWACSRSYGLGSRLPWDPQYLIESLSDSTIYMAYYTVCHLLQGGVVNGSKVGPAGIKPEQLTPEVWDYIFLGASYPPHCGIPETALQKLRKEFLYWYPVDLRVSGKDLIPNHLIFWIYTHTAIFPPVHWPRSVRANGHLLLNKQKMAKRTGNFITLIGGVEKYGADAMRFSLADAGDSLEDANFAEDTAFNITPRLFAQKDWIKEMTDEKEKLREGPPSCFADRVFDNEINKAIQLTEKAYERMLFHEALKSGFYDLQTARDVYRSRILAEKMEMNRDLIMRFIRVQILLLSPICPHFCEWVWLKLLNEKVSITKARWPESGLVDWALLRQTEFLENSLYHFRQKLIAYKNPKKGKKPEEPNTAHIYVASRLPVWQERTLTLLRKLYDENQKSFPDNKVINEAVKDDPQLCSESRVMPYISHIKEEVASRGVQALEVTLPFDEMELLRTNQNYIAESLGLKSVLFFAADAPDGQTPETLAQRSHAEPGKAAIFFHKK